ncbi:hypothetical protein GIB67_035883 [Kingdonia uniflora]|uniref:Uncharacterized protein n=1 Tax=Kingdonia uniflora TaxID=39325 RepID=A0A7J7P8L2_9MAGN|nr:hypothetical protein GIB67_035883 [Kingdonia uniflora]
MPKPDQCSWNSMVSGFAQCDCFEEVLGFFVEMHRENFVLNEYSYASALSSCAGLVDFKMVREIQHKNGFMRTMKKKLFTKLTRIPFERMGVYMTGRFLNALMKIPASIAPTTSVAIRSLCSGSDSESCKTTQNSGVKIKAMTNFVASARDQNPRVAETIYYGVAKEIIELDYYDFPQTVFYCDWVRVEDKVNGCVFDAEANLTFVNLQKLKRNSKVDDEPYYLASQDLMISPSQSTPSLPNPSEPLPIPVGGSHVEHSTTSGGEEVKASRETNKINRSKMVTPHTTGRKGAFRVANEMMEVDPTITRSDSFLVGHTRSDGTFPTALVAEKVIAVKEIIAKNPQSKYLDVDNDPLAQVFGKVKKGCVNFMGPDVTKKFIQSTELLRAQIMEGYESYIDLENRFSQYKAENDTKLDSLRDMVTSLRSFERAATPTVNVDRSRMFSPLLREEAIAHFLDLHENIVASERALVISGYQESEEAEYEVIVDIIFEQGFPVFGQRGVFFDELLIGTKIKYPRILLHFGY